MVDLMKDALRIMRWTSTRRTTTPSSPSAPASPSSRRAAGLGTAKDYFRDRNLLPNLAALQRNVDLTRDLGFIKASLDVTTYSDLSLAQDAAKRVP